MKPNHVDDKVHELTESFTCFSEHMALKTFGLSTALLSTNSGRPKKNQLWYNYRRLKNPFQKVTSEKINKRITLNSITGLNNQWFQFSSVTQSCPTLCDPMDCSTLGLPVHHQHPESTQTHVHWVGDAIQPLHPLSSPSSPALNLSQHQGLFKWLNSLHQVAKVLEFQLQHQFFQWTPRTDLLQNGLVGSPCIQGTLKSLLQHHTSKPSILQHSAFFTVQLSHPYMTSGKIIALTRQTFVDKVMSVLLVCCLGWS